MLNEMDPPLNTTRKGVVYGTFGGETNTSDPEALSIIYWNFLSWNNKENTYVIV